MQLRGRLICWSGVMASLKHANVKVYKKDPSRYGSGCISCWEAAPATKFEAHNLKMSVVFSLWDEDVGKLL